MLFLIGSGFGSFTQKGLSLLRRSDEVYIERYTGIIEDWQIEEWEQNHAISINELSREQVESDFLPKKAVEKNIALIAQGDPLTATTHISLILDAKELSVKWDVAHNASIYTAAPAKSGLQIYRFGRTTTLVNPRENYHPTSPLSIIKNNLENNLHSLVLLDTEPKPMSSQEALNQLSAFSKVVVISRIGFDDEKITYGLVEELKTKNLGKPPFTVIVPAKLHDLEKEWLEGLAL